jgi:hypothetical protein
MDLGLRIRAADRRVARSPHPSCPHSGDERRKLSARDQQKGSASARASDKHDRQNNRRERRRRGNLNRRRQHRAMLRYAAHASMLAAKKSKQGLRGPFLSTRPVHFYAAIWHIFSPPLTLAPPARKRPETRSDRLFPCRRRFLGRRSRSSPANSPPQLISDRAENSHDACFKFVSGGRRRSSCAVAGLRRRTVWQVGHRTGLRSISTIATLSLTIRLPSLTSAMCALATSSAPASLEVRPSSSSAQARRDVHRPEKDPA